jgi:hypothetical protein
MNFWFMVKTWSGLVWSGLVWSSLVNHEGYVMIRYTLLYVCSGSLSSHGESRAGSVYSLHHRAPSRSHTGRYPCNHPLSNIHMDAVTDSLEFSIVVRNQSLRYTVRFPSNLHETVVWMRSVDRDLRKRQVHPSIREELFLANDWSAAAYHRIRKSGLAPERQYTSLQRVRFDVNITSEPESQRSGMILKEEAYKRVRVSATRAVKRFKAMQEEAQLAVAPILCYGLLKTEGKYDQVRRLNNTMVQGKKFYGVSLPLQPSVRQGHTHVIHIVVIDILAIHMLYIYIYI